MISMGGTKHQIFYQVIVPSSLPAIIATFRINIGFGLVGAVVGEFISSKRGLGHIVYTASSLYDLNTVWVGLFVLMRSEEHTSEFQSLMRISYAVFCLKIIHT